MAVALSGSQLVASDGCSETACSGHAGRGLQFHGFCPPRLLLYPERGDFGKLLQRRSKCHSSRSEYTFGSLLQSPGESSRPIVGRWLLPLGWDVTFGGRFGRQCHSGHRKLINGSSKNTGATGDRPGEPKLDATDLLEMEFGRLLGEDPQTTLTKVIGKKTNPNLSFVELERQREINQRGQKKSYGRLKEERRQIKDGIASDKQVVDRSASDLVSLSSDSRKAGQKLKQSDTRGEFVPELASPPVRSKGMAEQTTLSSRAVPPVRIGGGKRSRVAADQQEYEDVIRKPVRPRPMEVGLPPELPVPEVIPPMLMRTKADGAPGSKQSRLNDKLLRRPAILSPIPCSSSSSQDVTMASPCTGNLQRKDSMESSDIAEKKPKGILQEQRLQVGLQMQTLRAEDISVKTDALLGKTVGPNLERKPTLVRKLSLSVPQVSTLQQTVYGAEPAAHETGNDAGSKELIEDLGKQSLQLQVQLKGSGVTLPSLSISPPPAEPLLSNMKTMPTVSDGFLAEVSSLQETMYVVESGVKEAGRSMPSISEPSPELKQRVRFSRERKPMLLQNAKPSLPVAQDSSLSPSKIRRTVQSGSVLFQDSVLISLPEHSDPSEVKQSEQNSGQDNKIGTKEKPMGKKQAVDADFVNSTPNLTKMWSVPKGTGLAPLTSKTAESISEYQEMSSPAPLVNHSDTIANPGTTVDTQTLDPSMFTEEQVKDFSNRTGNRQENVKDMGGGVDSAMVTPEPEDRKTKGEMSKATESKDLISDPQEKKKRMITMQHRPGPSLPKVSSQDIVANAEPTQPNTSLQSTLQKVIKMQGEKRSTTNKKDREEEDWVRAEALRDARSVQEVMVIGVSAAGLLAAFGSLVGYLPASELTAEKRPQSFVAWAQSREVDVKIMKPSIKTVGGLKENVTVKESVLLTPTRPTEETVTVGDAVEQRKIINVTAEKELLQLYREERANLLSLLAGEKPKLKVIVTTVDRASRQLRFSQRKAEGEEWQQAQKKLRLMESLTVGDVVTCQVKKVTPMGAFVELQGVPALIHISELSWNPRTSLESLQVGEEVEAKVCRLDRFLQRINLSLKQMEPDPLLETLESLVPTESEAGLLSRPFSQRGHESEIAVNQELDSVLSKIAASPDISGVVRGRRVRGSALAPAFQVYLSGPLDSGYKLLARFGNEVQEVLVETSVNREQMKEVIRSCMVQDT